MDNMLIRIIVVLAAFFGSPVYAEELIALKNSFPPSVCAFPGIQFPDDMVVLGAGGYKGRDTTYQMIGSKNVATQVDVAVNYNEKPVALFLGAYDSTIWNIGWTEGTNIVAVFVYGYHRQQVAGLKAGTPTLISTSEENGPCRTTVANFNNGTNTNPKFAETEQKLANTIFIRPITEIFSVSEDNEGKVVVGKPFTASEKLWTSNHTPPESFFDMKAPLVRQAGLNQAIELGVLRRATLNDASEWIGTLKKKYELQNRPPPAIPPDLNNAYVVLKKFTYPAGLHGGHSATFYIPVGVPLPSGDYGHSKVYDFNSITLECRAGSSCGKAMSQGEIGRGSTQQSMTIGR
jgi:hypothetical protein